MYVYLLVANTEEVFHFNILLVGLLYSTARDVAQITKEALSVLVSAAKVV